MKSYATDLSVNKAEGNPTGLKAESRHPRSELHTVEALFSTESRKGRRKLKGLFVCVCGGEHKVTLESRYIPGSMGERRGVGE